MTALLAVVLAGALGACADSAVGSGFSFLRWGSCPDNGSQGITDTTIRIGSTAPLSGTSVNGVSKGLDAFIAMVNAEGGVRMKDGRTRTIENVVIDDGNEVARSALNADELIDGHRVFALIGMYGTPASLAARAAASESCTPHLYMASGHQEFGNPKYPWVAAPAAGLYPATARTASDFILKNAPAAKVGLLIQQDDLGGTLRDAFVKALEGSDVTVVSEQTFDKRDLAVTGQVTTIAGSGADTFVMLAGSGSYQLRALEAIASLNWQPRLKYLTNFTPDFLDQLSDEAALGVHFGSSFKNVNGPEFADDEEVQLFRQWWAMNPEASSFDPYEGVVGWMTGRLLVQNLRSMPQPTRAALVEAATHLTYTGPSLYRPGIVYSIDWPDRPYGLVDEIVLSFDPRKPEGERYRPVQAVTQHGQFPYQSP